MNEIWPKCHQLRALKTVTEEKQIPEKTVKNVK
jgi:hypothetical protein